MAIWLALLIPVLVAFVLYFFFNHNTIWWEFLIPFGASFLLILIMKFSTELSQTSDTEYWSETASKAVYSEPWDEEVPCTHSYDCNCHTDSKGHEHCSTCYRHSYDVDYHPAKWELISSSGNSITISEAKYNYFVGKWKNKSFAEQNRDYHSIDGNCYITYWPQNDNMIECMVSSHSYENRIQASHSVFSYPELKETDIKFYGLYDYPNITEGYKQISILGYGDTTQRRAENKMQILNARLGPKKQAKVFVLIFKNKSADVAYQQECYWKGGNKNEFVVCIGIDNAYNVKWCRPFSFTEVQEVKIETRNFVQQMGQINLLKVSDFLYSEIDTKFKRKNFKDFSYITVEPKGWQVTLTFILTIIINVLLSLWIIKNEIDDDSSDKKYRSRF